MNQLKGDVVVTGEQVHRDIRNLGDTDGCGVSKSCGIAVKTCGFECNIDVLQESLPAFIEGAKGRLASCERREELVFRKHEAFAEGCHESG